MEDHGFPARSSALAQYAAGGCVYRRFAVVVKAVDGMASCACSLSIPRLFSPARVFWSGCTRERYVAVCGGGGRQHESGWAKLPVELLRKMLQALQAAEQWAPQGQRLVAQGLGDDAAGVQWMEVPPRCAGDVAVATDEGGVLVRRGGGTLDLKCYCFDALTDEVLQAVSSLSAFSSSLELCGCFKVTDAEHLPAQVQHAGAGWSREACCIISKYVPKRL